MNQVVLSMHSTCLAHGTGSHPESASRLNAIWDALQAASWPDGVSYLTPSAATSAQILAVHRPELVDFVRNLAARGGGIIGLDTVLSRHSYDAALVSAGGAIQVTRAAVEAPGTRGFALVRPPGHHATPETAMGFCLLNNIAIAARVAQNELGVGRVAIVDFDVHHGNGTQAVFYEDPSVFFCSLHQFPLYPGTGRAEETGAGPGKGSTLNLPLPPGCGDVAYQVAMREVVMPMLRRFEPELLLVSAGFDAHWADPLAQMRLSTEGFVALARTLVEFADEQCQGRIAFSLEGGYDLTALATSVVATIATLVGGEPRDVLGPPPGGAISSIGTVVERIKKIHEL
jgi:acetoin utilization deacetylase AcuC-like enzyme